MFPSSRRLEDFGLELKRDAVNYIIEFVYRGEVDILGEKLTDFCQAAHTLGVLGMALAGRKLLFSSLK
jgi:hypothetical protein